MLKRWADWSAVTRWLVGGIAAVVLALAARKKAGVPAGRENGMHALRHYFASTLLFHGVDIKSLRRRTGGPGGRERGQRPV